MRWKVSFHLNSAVARSQGTHGDPHLPEERVLALVRLALRMHAQHSDSELRRRCLDLIDQLAAFRAHDIEADLETIDR